MWWSTEERESSDFNLSFYLLDNLENAESLDVVLAVLYAHEKKLTANSKLQHEKQTALTILSRRIATIAKLPLSTLKFFAGFDADDEVNEVYFRCRFALAEFVKFLEENKIIVPYGATDVLLEPYIIDLFVDLLLIDHKEKIKGTSENVEGVSDTKKKVLNIESIVNILRTDSAKILEDLRTCLTDSDPRYFEFAWERAKRVNYSEEKGKKLYLHAKTFVAFFLNQEKTSEEIITTVIDILNPIKNVLGGNDKDTWWSNPWERTKHLMANYIYEDNSELENIQGAINAIEDLRKLEAPAERFSLSETIKFKVLKNLLILLKYNHAASNGFDSAKIPGSSTKIIYDILTCAARNERWNITDIAELGSSLYAEIATFIKEVKKQILNNSHDYVQVPAVPLIFTEEEVCNDFVLINRSAEERRIQDLSPKSLTVS